MISVEIPNDIAEYKPKLILGFTGRQVACVLLTAVCIFLDFRFLKPYVGDTFSLALAAIPAFLAALFGWGDKFTPGHIPFEKYLKTAFIESFVAPKIRKCKTSSSMIVPCDKYYVPIADSALSPEVLEAVNFVREKTGLVTDEVNEENNRKSQSKKRPSKYKKSKLAIV